MKKILTTLFFLISICSQTHANDYSDGYDDGFDAGYKLAMIEMENILDNCFDCYLIVLK